jgi:hypothetical protein
MGIEALIRDEMSVRPLQELHAALRALDVPTRHTAASIED